MSACVGRKKARILSAAVAVMHDVATRRLWESGCCRRQVFSLHEACAWFGGLADNGDRSRTASWSQPPQHAFPAEAGWPSVGVPSAGMGLSVAARRSAPQLPCGAPDGAGSFGADRSLAVSRPVWPLLQCAGTAQESVMCCNARPGLQPDMRNDMVFLSEAFPYSVNRLLI